MGGRNRRLVWVACALLAAGLWARPAVAHPHLWIAVEARVVYDGGSFTGIAQHWKFDDFYSGYALHRIDEDGDGVHDQDELAALSQELRETLTEFEYFTSAELAGEPLRFGEPSEHRLEVKDGTVHLAFTLPFSSPVPRGERALRFSVADPARFAAFNLTGADFLAAGRDLPHGCVVRVDAPAASWPSSLGA